jgi:protein-L-isoaspartate(D-aspartate) O-methyltransferase
LRRYYARLVTGRAETNDPRLIEAFAHLRRERFVGPGPWKIHGGPSGYIDTPSDELCFLYADVVVALLPDRALNNGEPHLHARCLAAVDVVAGERIAHIGAGTGYYTAMLAMLTGPTGSVVAFEIDGELASSATANLADLPSVTVRARSGSEPLGGEFDVIYVNAGATRPLDVWLDALSVGGRLLFPLTPSRSTGGMLLVTRKAVAEFDARFLQPARFIACEGARNEQEAEHLRQSFARCNMDEVRSLHRDNKIDETSWCAGCGWWLSTRANA